MDHLQKFSQSPSAMQSFTSDCPRAHDTSDSYSDSYDSVVCEIQEQATTSLPKTRLYAHLSVSTSANNSKLLYLRYRLDTAVDVNVIPVGV